MPGGPAWLAAAITMLACGLALAQAPASNPLDNLPRTPSPAGGSSVQIDVTPPPSPAQQVLAQAVTPSRFDIEGVKSIPFPEVSALFTPLIGQPVTVAQIVERARQATALYRSRDFALSFFYVPAQDFAGGVVRIAAVEGHVGTVVLEGDAGKGEKKLREIAAGIQREKPLRARTFDHYTGVLGQLPGMAIEAQVLLPVTTDGASTMTLKVTRKPYDVSLGIDARRKTPRAVVTGVLNDPFASGSRLSASALLSSSSDEQYQALQYQQFIGGEGWSVTAGVSRYRGNPDEQLGVATPLQRLTTNLRRDLSASKPVRLSQTGSFVVTAGVYSVDNDDRYSNPANGAVLTDESRVRAVFGKIVLTENEERRSRYLSVMLAHGLSGAGSRSSIVSNVPGLSGPGPARTDFVRAVVDASESYRWASGFGVTGSLGAQYSPHTLPGTERISFGGTRFARGYAPGETAGDSGLGLGLELNRAIPVSWSLVSQVQPYVLAEVARSYTHVGTPAPSRLRSFSVGTRVSDARHFTVDLALSKPMGDTPIENAGKKPRLSLQVSYRLGQ